MRTETTLTHAEARTAIDAIASACAPKGLTAVIAVADNHGELIGLLRLAGAPLASVQIAANKAYSAARERKPSREIGAASKHPVSGFEITYFGDPRFTGWGGGLPVFVGGECVGAVAVSGLSEDEDVDLAAIGVRAISQAAGGRATK
jgi:glc operon protein GlcG